MSWLGETLVASTLLMLAVLALRGSVADVFGPRIAYALWLIPALRMALPPFPEQVAAPMPAIRQAVLPASYTVPVAPSVTAAPAFDWALIVFGLWIAGAAVHFAISLFAYARFVRRLRSDARPVAALDARFPIWASHRVDGPLAIGIVARAIVLPHDYATRYAPGELALALRHEAAHHARGDLAVNLVALALRSAHWFNPVAAYAYRAFRADQELACDAAVIAHGSRDDRHAYGCAVVKSASDRMPAAACALHRKDQLKRRLSMMGRKTASRTRVVFGGVAVALLLGAGLGLTASGSVAAEKAERVGRQAARAIVPRRPEAPVAEKHVIYAPDVRIAQADVEAPPVPRAPPSPPSPPPLAELSAIPPVPPIPAIPPIPPLPDRAEFQRVVDAAMLEVEDARTALEACRGKGAKCFGVDLAEIRGAALEGMREAREEIAGEINLSDKRRAQVIASLDAAIARMERDPRWRR